MKVGDKVKWTSQSQGYVKTKEGVVAAIIPANVHPRDRDIKLRLPGGSRNHESYVVRVGRSHLYWPLVSKLVKP